MVEVREVRLAAGAGFVVAICGDIMTMPGLPRMPAAEAIGLDENGSVVGLFRDSARLPRTRENRPELPPGGEPSG